MSLSGTRIEHAIGKWEIPGLALAIYRNHQVETQQFGVSSKETGLPVTATTVFGVGSISKVFTATLAMRLVDAGKLDLDEPILEVFPQLALADPCARQKITMRHLLSHQAGFAGDGFIDHGNDANALPEFVATFGSLPQTTNPGEAWSYSNNGVCLAGAVLASICDTTFEAAMQAHVFDPLGLARTGFGQPPIFENAATGYEFGRHGVPEARPAGNTTRSANPAGGVVSCVEDLIRFAQAHLGTAAANEPFLTPGSRAEMQQTQDEVSSVEAWGLGWGKLLEGNTWMVEHGGWMDGYRAQLTLLPDHQAAFAILNNGPLGHAAIQDIQTAILDDVFGIRDSVLNPVALTANALNAYVGNYEHSHMDITITLDPETPTLILSLKTVWHGAENDAPIVTPLKAVNEREFVIDGGEFDGSRLVFLTTADGAVNYLRILHRLARKI